MTIRFTTVEGNYKILEVTDLEVEIAGADMQTLRGGTWLRVRERGDE